tara:strand:+ start:410 stop:745 length:336 start_codon:yes stop_codon:yes gene_type:complete
MEKFFYIGDISASNIGLSYPVESWRGAHPSSDTVLNIYFTPVDEGGLASDKDNDVIHLTLSSANKHKDVMESIVEAMNTSDEHVINIIDIDNSLKINDYISSVSVTMSSDV